MSKAAGQKIYTPQAGEHIDQTVTNVADAARLTNMPVHFTFNGADVIAHPGQQASAIKEDIKRQWESTAAAHRVSPEGKKEALEAAERLAKHQMDHDELMLAIPKAFASEAETMQWLVRYSKAVVRGVVGVDYPSVIRGLEASGYKRNDIVDLPQERYTNPGTIAQWIGGQAIDCMYRGLPPHQVIEVFVNQYKSIMANRRKA